MREETLVYTARLPSDIDHVPPRTAGRPIRPDGPFQSEADVNLDRIVLRSSSQREGTPRFVTRAIGDDTLIVPVCSGVGELDAIYTLNEPASRVWTLLASPSSVRSLAEALCAEYDVSIDTAARDVVELIDALESRGLVAASQGY